MHTCKYAFAPHGPLPPVAGSNQTKCPSLLTKGPEATRTQPHAVADRPDTRPTANAHFSTR
eukprot:13881734-Alexandrium_andersonii.AAC.1